MSRTRTEGVVVKRRELAKVLPHSTGEKPRDGAALPVTIDAHKECDIPDQLPCY